MPRFCVNCGSPLKEGARFCSKCGNPVPQTGQPFGPIPSVQNSNGKRMPSNSPKKKKNGALVALLFVALVAVVTYGVVDFVKNSPKQAKSQQGQKETPVSADIKTIQTEKGRVSVESPAVTLCGVTIDAVPEMLRDGSQPVSVSVLESSVDKEGIRSENYELEMGSHERFEVPVEVTFPCTIVAKTDVIVEHYNGETESWTPLFSTVDEENQTVSAYFGSFSPARVRYIPIGRNPGIYRVVTPDEDRPFVKELWVSDNYWKILQRINPSMYSDEVTKFKDNPENYAVPFPELDPNMDLKAMNEAFTDASNLWTFLDPIINFGIGALPEASENKAVQFMMDHSEKLGNAMNAIPFVIMGVQLASDMNYALKHPADKDAHKTVAMNLCKGLVLSSGTIYSMVTGYSHYGFTLAFFGVSMFALELDYFVNAAKAEQVANVEAVFDAYYRDVEPFDAYHWYQVFESAYWKYSGNADAAMEEIRDEVNVYCRKFWDEVYKETNEDLLFATTSAGYKNTFFNATAEQKQALTERQKQKVWKLIETESMKYIQRFMMERMQESTIAQLSEAVKDYNQVLYFEIEEKVDPDMTSRFLGRTICLGIDEKPFKEWSVTVPDEKQYENGWTIDFWCSVYGYLQMGLPNQVLVYDDVKDFKAGKAPKEKMDFKAKMDGDRKTHIVLVTENPELKKETKKYICNDLYFLPDQLNFYYPDDFCLKAVNDACKKVGVFELQSNGDFSFTSSGSYSESIGGDDYFSSADATVTVNGHIDENTSDMFFAGKVTVVYHHNTAKRQIDDITATYDFSGTYEDGSTYESKWGLAGWPNLIGLSSLRFSGRGTFVLKGEAKYTDEVVNIDEKCGCSARLELYNVEPEQ